MAKNKIFTTVINMKGTVDASVRKGFEEVEKRLSDLDAKSVAVGASVAAIGAGLVVGTIQAGKAMVSIGDEYIGVMNDLQAKTGATSEQMEVLSDVVDRVYVDNLGEDWQDIADAVALAQQNVGDFESDLTGVTKGALILRDTFDYDVNESLRASKALMQNFGVDGYTAMNYIAEGAQNGLDFSGEFLDSISEYSVQFAKVGMDVDDMFHIMQAGTEVGAWKLDTLANAIKEFAVAAIDGSETTQEAFAALGYDAGEVMNIFAKGGEDASLAFQQILEDIMSMDDEVARDAIGVSLFKTTWEDLGVEAVAALGSISDNAYITGDALAEIGTLQYDSLDLAIQGIGRQLETGLAPVATDITQKLKDLAPPFQEKLTELMPQIEALATKFGDFLVVSIDKASGAILFLIAHSDTLIPTIATLGGIIGAFQTVKMITGIYHLVKAFGILQIAHAKEKADTIYLMALYTKDAVAKGASTAATIAQTVATGAWNVAAGIGTAVTTAFGAAMAFLTSPIGLVILAIGALIGIGVLLYKNWDTVKMYAAQLGTFLSGVWSNMSIAVSNFIAGIKNTFLMGFSTLVGIVKAPINAVISLINGAIGGINSISVDVPDWVPLFGGKHFGVSIPTLPMLAKGGFTKGISIAGESGTEAVISFDPSVRSENLSYWAKAGQMLGALPDDVNPLESSTNNMVSIGEINFSPKIEITGNAEKEDIMTAIEAEYPEFIDLLERWFEERGYFAYEN